MYANTVGFYRHVSDNIEDPFNISEYIRKRLLSSKRVNISNLLRATGYFYFASVIFSSLGFAQGSQVVKISRVGYSDTTCGH